MIGAALPKSATSAMTCGSSDIEKVDTFKKDLDAPPDRGILELNTFK